MPRRTRIVAFGSAGALTVAGVVCLVLVNGLAGQILAIALLSLGLGGALLLVFFEVGLSEDHERAREEQEQRRRRSSPPPHAPRPGRSRRRS